MGNPPLKYAWNSYSNACFLNVYIIQAVNFPSSVTLRLTHCKCNLFPRVCTTWYLIGFLFAAFTDSQKKMMPQFTAVPVCYSWLIHICHGMSGDRTTKVTPSIVNIKVTLLWQPPTSTPHHKTVWRKLFFLFFFEAHSSIDWRSPVFGQTKTHESLNRSKNKN